MSHRFLLHDSETIGDGKFGPVGLELVTPSDTNNTRAHHCFETAYMAVTNLVKEQEEDHAKRIAEFAIDAIAAANSIMIDPDAPEKGYVNIRVGFHSGPGRYQKFGLLGKTVVPVILI